MALSSSKVVGVGAYWSLILEWDATQSITNNTSTVEARLYWQGDSAVFSSATKDVSITIDGSKKTGTTTAGLSAGQKKLILTHTKTVSHNSTGEKSVAISGVFDMEVTLSGTYYSSKTASSTWALNPIARKSSFTLNDTALYYDQEGTITINRASSAFTHTATYTIGSVTRPIGTAKTTATSIKFTPDIDDLIYFPNAKYGNATLRVETFNGSTSVGYNTLSFQIHARNVPPTINSFTVTDNNSAIRTLMGTGNYVQGHSDFTFAVGATGKYGATIKSHSISFNGQSSTLSSWNYGLIIKSGNITATATVTDSRGYATTDTLVVSIIAYSSPRISSFTGTRLVATPETVRTNYTVTISDLMVGLTAKNTVSVQLQYKLRTSTTWTTFGTYTTVSRLTDVPGLLESSSYDLRILVSDKLTSGLVSVVSISTAAVLMDLAQLGIGVGKMWERGALDIKGSAYLNGSLHLDKNFATRFMNEDSTTYTDLNMKDGIVTVNGHKFMEFQAGSSTGRGLQLGGGGRTIIGAGESVYTIRDNTTFTTEQEYLMLGADENAYIYTDLQNGWATKKEFRFDQNGYLYRPKYKEPNGYNMVTARAGTAHDDLLLIQDYQGSIVVSGMTSVNITFPTAFSAAPEWVIVSARDSSSSSYHFAMYNATATGCTIYANHIHDNKLTYTTYFTVVACGKRL